MFKEDMARFFLSYDVAPGSEIMPCIKIDKLLVVYRFWESLCNDAFSVTHMAKP